MEKEEKKVLKQIIQKEGKVFLGLVHPHLYGPVRGINAVLLKPDLEEVATFIQSIRPGELCVKFHSSTFMACQMMILPNDLISECETPPSEFDSIDALVAHIEAKIGEADKNHKANPLHYRLGII